jgi:hypothetical protein
VSIQLANNSTAFYAASNNDNEAAATTEDLYLVAPEPLEPEYLSVNGGGGGYGSRRDRSLSLPSVHGNFRLLRSAQFAHR